MAAARVVDMRTDTSSLPTDEMRQAMASAEVGNDGFGEDPTVNRLERLAADTLGKEAALFVSSGMMGNLLALLAQVGPGRAALFGGWSHLQYAEAPALARFGGIVTVPLDDDGGAPDPDLVREVCRRAPGRAAALCVENTHNFLGGRAMALERMEAYAALAQELGLRLHLDGARLFNAAVALGVEAAVLAAPAHSVMFCLSKGLCAPVGSMLVSDRETIARARELRRLLGGQMRQAGVLAAAGIVALEQMIPRLAEDHANARRLAEGLRRVPGIVVVEEPQTNMVLCRVTRPWVSEADFVARAEAVGVRCVAIAGDRLRFCLYRDVSADDVACAITALQGMAA